MRDEKCTRVSSATLGTRSVTKPSYTPTFSVSQTSFLVVHRLVRRGGRGKGHIPRLSIRFSTSARIVGSRCACGVINGVPKASSSSVVLLDTRCSSCFRKFRSSGTTITVVVKVTETLLHNNCGPHRAVIMYTLTTRR